VTAGEKHVARRPCPVCDNTRVTNLYSPTFVVPSDYLLDAAYDVVCCTNCGAAYADTDVTQERYDQFYANASKYADTRISTGAGVLAWDDARLEVMARAIFRFVPDQNARIVDVGCAAGGLLRWLGMLGYRRLYGIDPAETCVAATEQIPGVTAAVGSLFNVPPGYGAADCVVLSHVLEHVREVSRAISQLREIVAPRGMVYVEVPDATRYHEFISAPFQDFNTEHINHFSATTLSRALEEGGFTVDYVGTKVIEASPGVPYPALFLVARMDNGSRDTARIRDDTLCTKLRRYIDRSQERVKDIDAHLRDALAGTSALIVWGVGQTTMKLLNLTILGKAPIVAFVDGNPIHHGKRLVDAPVLAPEALATLPPHPILVGSMIHHHAIAQRIRDLGLANRLILLDGAEIIDAGSPTRSDASR
jgi:2-polyprenyl-3-methyl-5-hydroxy-6-metoxy-1,4-benzoquinol methylase